MHLECGPHLLLEACIRTWTKEDAAHGLLALALLAHVPRWLQTYFFGIPAYTEMKTSREIQPCGLSSY